MLRKRNRLHRTQFDKAKIGIARPNREKKRWKGGVYKEKKRKKTSAKFGEI